jgi:asparagine synthase (glutamine-hydrolysing)
MAHSLEVRVPFLDTRLLDLALSLPDGAKLNPSPGSPAPPGAYRSTGAKRILIDMGRPMLPKDFDRQTKRGFTMPFGHWLRGPLKGIVEETLSLTSVRKRGWLDPEAVAHTRNDLLDGRSGWARPWLLMMLELWAVQVLDQQAQA